MYEELIILCVGSFYLIWSLVRQCFHRSLLLQIFLQMCLRRNFVSLVTKFHESGDEIPRQFRYLHQPLTLNLHVTSFHSFQSPSSSLSSTIFHEGRWCIYRTPSNYRTIALSCSLRYGPPPVGLVKRSRRPHLIAPAWATAHY